MTQPQIELLPCPNPSCNNDNVDLMSVSIGECNWTVGCNECAMTGPQAFTTVQAATGWNLLPRPIPAVAPGLRNSLCKCGHLRSIHTYRGILMPFNSCTETRCRCSGFHVDAEPIADIAAAQGGTVDRDYHTEEFRKTLIKFVNEWLWASDFRRTGGQPWDSDYTADAIRMIQDALSQFNPAAPSAPGWTEPAQPVAAGEAKERGDNE